MISSGVIPHLPGRERELAEVAAILGASAAGQVRVVVVTGEPGIGKTRLLDEIGTMAVARKFRIARTACDEESMPVAFAPLQQIVADLGQAVDNKARFESLAEHLRRLPREATEPELRLAATDFAARVIRMHAAHGPITILIDDVQWLDESSASVFRRLIRTVRYVPATLVVAYRGDDPRVTGAGDRFVEQVSRDPACRLVPLRRLNEEATRSIVASHIRSSTGEVAALCDEIQRQSEGVPLYVVELTSHLLRSGLLTWNDGQWQVENGHLERIPLNIRSLLDQRMNRLGETHQRVLEVAAALGSDIQIPLLRAVVQSYDPHLTQHLEMALNRAVELELLVREERPGRVTWRFSHQLYRDRLYAGIGHGARRSIHDAAATVLQALGTDQPVERVAYHAIRGRDPVAGVRAASRAASASATIHAWEDASQWLEVALDLLDNTPLDTSAASRQADQRVELAIERDTYIAVIGDPEARRASARMLEQLASPSVPASVRSDLLVRATRGLVAGGDLGGARLLADKLPTFTKSADADVLVQLWIAIGEAAVGRPIGEPAPIRSDLDELRLARDAFRRALAGIPESASSTRGALLQELGVVEAALSDRGLVDRDVAHGRLQAALDAFRAAQDRRGETTALIALAYRRNIEADDSTDGSSDRFVGFLEEIRRLRATEHRIVGATDQPRDEALSLLSTHLYCRTHGWWELALDKGAQARHWADEARDPRVSAIVEVAMSECAWLVGRGNHAFDHAERAIAALDQFADHSNRRGTLHWQATQARVRAHGSIGDTARAVALARHGVADASRPRGVSDGQATALLVEALETAGLLDEARALAGDALRGAVGLPAGTVWDIQLDLALSRMALAMSDGQSALAHAAAASARISERRTPFVWLRLAAGHARVASLLSAGHERDGREASVEPTELAGRVLSRTTDPALHDEIATGAPYLADLLRLVERNWPDLKPSPEIPPPGIDHPLTARELEVMQLVAAGRSNQEIADTLFISVKTVARHLTNVYTKIGAESRTQAAAWAFRNRIV